MIFTLILQKLCYKTYYKDEIGLYHYSKEAYVNPQWLQILYLALCFCWKGLSEVHSVLYENNTGGHLQ